MASTRVDQIESLYDAVRAIQDKEQCMLENARVLWDRHAEENRKALEEHAEYVRSMATLSAFMAGFVNIALVQFDFDSTRVPYVVLMGFAVTNALTTAVNTCCMVICTFMLGSTFKTFLSLHSEEEEAAFMIRSRAFAKQYRQGNKPPTPPRTFRTHWEFFCRREWQRVVCLFTIGIIFFIANTAFAAFIKFDDYWVAAISLCLALSPGFLFCLYLHLRWIPYILLNTELKPVVFEQKRHAMGMPFDWHLPGVKPDPAKKGFVEVEAANIYDWSLDSTNKLPPWRAEMLKQLTLDNCYHLWSRYVVRTRHELEERVEQLRSFSFLSGVVAGFAIAALLQLQIEVEQTEQCCQIWFATSAGICAACSLCAMVMCSLILISIVKRSRALISEEAEARYVDRCLEFAHKHTPGVVPPAPAKTFQNHWDTRCEGEWNRAFYLFAVGLASFVLNVVAGVWIKYNPYSSISIAATACMGVAILYLLLLYSRWAPYLTGYTRRSRGQAYNLPQGHYPGMGLPFDWHLPPQSAAKPQQ